MNLVTRMHTKETESGHGKIYHNHFALHIPEGEAKANRIALNLGFKNRGPIGTLSNHFLFEHEFLRPRCTNHSLEHHEILIKEPGVHWFEQQHERRRFKRDLSDSMYISDPLFKDQWFLNHGAFDGSDMNVQPAWAKGYTGKRVVVTILDDGIQTDHPDLRRNYDPLASTDINGNDEDPMPQDNSDNKHGTRCAGEVAAEAFNGICGVGIAYNASIGGVRMLDGLVNDAVEARALSLNPNHIDIYSASWGPEDDGKTVDGPGPLAKKAFINGVKFGRDGKGSIFVWASGNGGRKVDNCNCDGYTNSIFTLSISSASQGGKKPWYLEECSSTLASTYSSGTPGHDASIATVDQDARLRPDKICTTSHTGTSASAPIAAGVCALALEANPNLTWRDMQHIVVITSNPAPLLRESGWRVNAVGRKYSHKFGYGLMDASAMVEVAKVWPGSGRQAICETDTLSLDLPIPVNSGSVARVTLKTDACSGTKKEIRYLEHVQCKISLHYHPRGALHIVLTSPSGTKSSLLLPRPRDMTNGGFEDWPFLSVHFWGEPANGTWTLEVNHSPSVKSTSGLAKGIVKKWKMLFYGTRKSPLRQSQLVSEFGPLPSEDFGDGLPGKMMDGSPEDGHNVSPNNNGQHVSWSSGSFSTRAHSGGILEHNKGQSGLLDYESPSSSCHPQCEGNRCSGPKSTECYSCQNFKFGNVCVEHCPLTTYVSLRGTCQACHSSCQTCSGPNPNQCLTCSKSLFLLSDQSRCIKDQCPSGYRQRPSLNECVPCPYHCESCTETSEGVVNLIEGPRSGSLGIGETTLVCLKCQKGLVRSVLENKCLNGCPFGFSLNPETRSCDPCHESCATCTGNLSTQCSLCLDGTFYFEHKCVPDCPAGYRPDVHHQECVPCPQGCHTCSNDQKCIKCQAGWSFANEKEACSPQANAQCPEGSFKTRSCDPCHESCATCTGNLSTQCSLCLDGTFYFEHKCVPDCPAGYRPDVHHQECVPCPQGCHTCSNDQKCIKCQAGWSFANEKEACSPQANAQCPEGSFSKALGGLCAPCGSTCNTCFDKADNCLSCPKNHVLDLSSCLDHECPNGTFYDTQLNECRHCPHNCMTCESVSSCSQCGLDHFLTGSGKCSANCQGNEYQTPNGLCLACNRSCEACMGPHSNECLSCRVGKYLSTTGECLEECLHGFVDKNSQCQACHSSCLACTGPSLFQCSTCPSGTKLGPQANCLSCEPRKFHDAHSDECLACHESCGTCSGPQDNHCLSCSLPLVLDTWNTTCVPCCESSDEKHCCSCTPSRDKCLQPSKKMLSRKRSSVRFGLGDEALTNPSRSLFHYGSLLAILALMTLVIVKYFKRAKIRLYAMNGSRARRHHQRRRQTSQDLSGTNYQKLLKDEQPADGPLNFNRNARGHDQSEEEDDEAMDAMVHMPTGNGDIESIPLFHMKT
eukprot:snap_masked-scaffold298_size217389-processed-gene-0.1 protein:Tk12571 transcript:snap_masked-scaffold298_size217389-processed-gene-0.1-mRNA-1 annotation:"endoprotease furin"